MKNKILCLIFAMVLVIAMLASCNGGGEETPDGETPGGETPGETPNTKDPNKKLDWDTTELLFEMNMNSNNDELSSGVKRYYAGEDNQGVEIDELVRNRNRDAYADAKVSIKYSFVGEGDANFAWGKNADTIYTKTASGSQNNPDMYCHFAYDMVNASIKGSFANLYSTSYDSNKNGKGENYFRFTEVDYNPNITNFFDSQAGEGYFKAYMDSLSLSSGKAYCLASDYCTDLVRSFLVIPVNVSLLSQVNLEMSDAIVDVDADGVYEVNDFYTMVWNNEWNYDMLAAISAAVYQNTNTANDATGATTTLGDRIGFAAGVSSGLTGSAFLYTTDVTLINKDTLTYPESNETLNQFALALNKLFGENKMNGICTVSTADANAFGDSRTGADLLTIRDEFAKGNILFGGTIAVGSLEGSVYQGMKANGGFGIVPVPVYKDGLEYKTLVHNLARIVGISVVAIDEFEMCTAFLNEVSTNSADILNEYYEVNLAAVVGGEAGADNVKMLTYIRNHVNDCFDKTFEDMISNYKEDKTTRHWHGFFMDNNYQVSSMGDTYGQYATAKGSVLEDIKTAWNRLP